MLMLSYKKYITIRKYHIYLVQEQIWKIITFIIYLTSSILMMGFRTSVDFQFSLVCNCQFTSCSNNEERNNLIVKTV